MKRSAIILLMLSCYGTGAIAGGSSGAGVVDWRAKSSTDTSQGLISSFIDGSLLSKIKAYYTALSLIKEYWDLATKEWGNTDDAHVRAAYLWGYEVGDPEVVEQVRSAGEVGQFFYYGTASQFGIPVDYDPRKYTLEKGGLLDSALDIEVSIMGAEDRQAGEAAEPPTAEEAQEMTGLSLL